ncbi:hypothetical protein NESM_000480200 [Novymonas esmeraldas]|uniref:Uncharacterized protein n=1 Tax=Novymonas esmeraldas TaxID=1808958 RepID=A0AAW0EQL1_9TRYP
MVKNVGDDARRRNGAAVRRMFDKSTSQLARAGAEVHEVHDARAVARGGAADALEESTRQQLRISSTSAAALVGVVGGDGAGARPAWCEPDRRGLLSRPSLDVPSHLGRQMEIAAQMGTLTAAQQATLLARAAPVSQSTGAALLEEMDGADRSCFLLEVQKARHARGIDARAAEADLTPYEVGRGRWVAYHHQQAVLRHERTLARRRVVDPYVQLTGAQVDVSPAVPNTYTADRLVERREGRWVLDNPHRQHLYRGEPVMTRIMQGEFYGEGAARRAAGVARRDVSAKNRRDVRVTSEINRAERLRCSSPSRKGIRSK